MVQTNTDGYRIYRIGGDRWNSHLRRGSSALAHMLKKESVETKDAGLWHAQLYRDHTTLKSMWRHLEKTGCCTPFQTYDWVSAWYETVAATVSAEPIIITASRNKEPE